MIGAELYNAFSVVDGSFIVNLALGYDVERLQRNSWCRRSFKLELSLPNVKSTFGEFGGVYSLWARNREAII